MLVVEFGVGVRGELTPAHTGNDVKASTPTQPSRAHPRAYGERLVIGEIHLVNKSSPPRIRGMLDAIGKFWNGIELTPAHTGNALSHKA